MASEMIADDSEKNQSDQKNSDTFYLKSEQEKRNSSVLPTVLLSPHGHLKKRTEHCFRNLPGLPAPQECNGNDVCSIVPPSNSLKTLFSAKSKLMSVFPDNNDNRSVLIKCQNDVLSSEKTFTPCVVEPNHTSQQSVDDKHKYSHVQEKEIKSGTVQKLKMIARILKNTNIQNYKKKIPLFFQFKCCDHLQAQQFNFLNVA